MEDPIRFDVWARPLPERRDDAVSALLRSGMHARELDARVAVNKAITSSQPMQIAAGCTWSEACAACEEWATDVTFSQEGYAPSANTRYCPHHNLHYGGILGCHVCRGFYAP